MRSWSSVRRFGARTYKVVLGISWVLCALSQPTFSAQSHASRFRSQGSAKVDSSKEKDLFSRLEVHGDSRFRFENTSHSNDESTRNRLVFRVRLGADYAVNQRFSGGLRLATGSPDDPNSTDVTFGDFNDDFGVSLDQAFLRYSTKDVSLTGGKFENPFLSTDLVWDGDVNPEGVAGTAVLPRVAGVKPTLVGLFFLINEDPDGRNSLMEGGQIRLRSSRFDPLRISAAAGYYDYQFRSLNAAGPGDTRSNRLNAERTSYRSDFNLVDVLARVRYSGLEPDWPVEATLNYVHNVGAVDGEDDGVRASVQAGRESRPGDVRLRYGYTQVETDAVLGAFSNDNIPLATNYRQHAVTIGGVVLRATTLNLTGYFYRPLRSETTGGTRRYSLRLRLNLSVSF